MRPRFGPVDFMGVLTSFSSGAAPPSVGECLGESGCGCGEAKDSRVVSKAAPRRRRSSRAGAPGEARYLRGPDGSSPLGSGIGSGSPSLSTCPGTFASETITRALAKSIADAAGHRLRDFGGWPTAFESACPGLIERVLSTQDYDRGDGTECAQGVMWLLVDEGTTDELVLYVISDETYGGLIPTASCYATAADPDALYAGEYCILQKIEVTWRDLDWEASRTGTTYISVELILTISTQERSDSDGTWTLALRGAAHLDVRWEKEGDCFTGWQTHSACSGEWEIVDADSARLTRGSGDSPDEVVSESSMCEGVGYLLDGLRYFLRRLSCEDQINEWGVATATYLLATNDVDEVDSVEELEDWCAGHEESCGSEV